ncbi:unnamed protein product [Cyprideis torosa]|uniref:Uncharacterized protein n=1 Tax=Cyprideis torosa TaxID=163714 RepID=A0A7R8ZUA7_9CRUS|nr:unnamed protein product [Cyprideis torosa]CAG0905540.1 unnamed protein product [Cyprideis torosa]
MFVLRKLMQGDERVPKAPLGNNLRPLHPLSHRTVRTNIDFLRKEGDKCPPTMKPTVMYKEEPRLII